ncbi:hypothetical protein KSP40_PGU020778 [Platanthera guangdongensis]|uniref:AAA+ ATPase domain-containing protein n=1 Tax=Platanthera guangdongensis TaxID=2320717 RepID=A0ABR2N4W2_9ASPA
MDKTYGCNTLKNALLIAGPVGIGKSSAVYACARELGFKVIEVNASSLRNGAYLRQTFGEAVDSLGLLHWLVDDKFHQTSKPMLELLSSLPDVANNEFQVDSNEMGSKKCNERNATGKKSAPSQVANKTLLLFEEVDIVFNDDHGFISTILKLAEITKRPIILTSNKRKSVLPQPLNRLTVLEFKAPSYQELLCHVSMVCTFEKVRVSCNLLEHIIYACLCDIRRILMLLQFWCQGMRNDTDHSLHSTKISVPFDIDAAHFAIPKIIPWDFHCELSEKLENEICRTISTVNQNDSLVGIALQHKLSSKGNFDPWEINSFVNGPASQSLHNHKKFLNHIDNLEILFDDSYSPLSSSQRLFQKKHDIALSSPSNPLPTSPITLTSPTHEIHGILPIARIEESFNSFEETSISRVCDTYDIHDVSCVPQSSLVSEDKTNTTSCFLSGAISHKQDLTSFSSPNRFTCIRPEVHLTNSDERTLEASKFSRNAAFYLESIQGNEDLVGFENEVKYESSHFQLINDECSRAGFNVCSALKERFACSQEVASVPEAWRKFRTFRGQYKSLLSANSKHASSVASITSKLTDLISEMDIIHQSCNSALCESLEPTATFRVEYGLESCYDTRIDMGFTFAQHGFYFYMMKCATFGSWLGRNSTADVSVEILASSTNSIALGILLTHENCTGHIPSPKALDVKSPQTCMLTEREPVAVPVAKLYDIILRVVPIRLSMVLKGPSFHEYLSFLMHISRLVASLPVGSWEHKPKRRTSLHHLSSCARHFTSEQMELLASRSRVCSSSSSVL